MIPPAKRTTTTTTTVEQSGVRIRHNPLEVDLILKASWAALDAVDAAPAALPAISALLLDNLLRYTLKASYGRCRPRPSHGSKRCTKGTDAEADKGSSCGAKRGVLSGTLDTDTDILSV